jgi:hypothetical protein
VLWVIELLAIGAEIRIAMVVADDENPYCNGFDSIEKMIGETL